MLISDTVMMVCLIGFCTAWFWRTESAVPRWQWSLPIIALAASITSVSQGRWQAMLGGVMSLLLIGLLLSKKRNHVRKRKPYFTALVLLVASLLAYAPLYLMPVFDLPMPSGTHPVATRTFELIDHTRLGVMEADALDARRLHLQVWYPATPSATAGRRPYADADQAAVTFAGLSRQVGLPSFFFSHLKLVDTHSTENQSVIEGEDRLPVVIYSHGYLSYGWQNTVLMEHLASHGYLVFSVTHPLDAAPVVFADGSVIAPSEEAISFQLDDEGDPIVSKNQLRFFGGESIDQRHRGMMDYMTELRDQDSRLLRSAKVWLDDQIFVSKSLAAGDVPESIQDLMGRGDFSRVAHIGMSFGGSTAAAAGYRDPRCVAAVNLDGGDYHRVGINANSPVPLLMFHSDWRYFDEMFGSKSILENDFGFNDFSYERHADAGQLEYVYRVRVRDVRHLGISDYPLILRSPLSDSMVGSIDGETMMNIMNDFVCGFLDQHLRQIDSDFPMEPLTKYRGTVTPHNASRVRDWWLTKSSDEVQTIEKRLDECLDRAIEQTADLTPTMAP